MKASKPFALLFLLLCAGCLPRWAGEECNFPVVKLIYYGTGFPDQEEYVTIDSLGVTKITHLERGEDIPIRGWEQVPNMSFARYNSSIEILLPIDVESTQSTFVIERAARNDTVILTYGSRLDMVEGCGYSYMIDNLEATVNGQGNFADDFSQHPRIVAEVGVFQ